MFKQKKKAKQSQFWVCLGGDETGGWTFWNRRTFYGRGDEADPVVHGKNALTKSAVEALESHNDTRYRYFNHKIHTLMMKKEVLSQLHT